MLFVPCIHNFKINRLIRTEQRDGPQIRTQLVLRMALLFFFFWPRAQRFWFSVLSSLLASPIPREVLYPI